MCIIIYHESSDVSCRENHRALIGKRPSHSDVGPFHSQSDYPKKAPKEPDNLGTEDHQVDDHDTDEHHHGVTLDFLGTLGSLLFQIVLLNLPHIEADHLEVHPLVVAAKYANQSPDYIRQHGAADAGFKMDEGVFIVAGFHIGNGLVELGSEIFARYPAVGSKDLQHISVIFQILPDGKGKARNLILNELAPLFHKVKNLIIG